MTRRRWMLAVVLSVVASALPLLPTAPTTPAQAFSACLATSAEGTLTFAGNQLLATVDDLSSTTTFPRSTNASGDWTTKSASDWTSGFFPGLLWQMYLHTGTPAFRTAAEAWSGSLASQATRTDTHDVGFMVGIPASLAFEATGTASYENTLLTAAASLASRYDADVGAIRSWDFGGWTFPVIVDNMMNLELLRQGADATPSSSTATTWRSITANHSARTAADHVRSDGSTFHLVDYNDVTGEIEGKQTHAGAADDSTWARGQAWALYGFTMMYREASSASDLAAAREVADYFIDNLPADNVPYWDFDAPGIPSAAKDSSAAAIAASGLLELADLTSGSDAATYFAAACDILDALMSSTYLSNGTNSAGILLHGTGNHPAGTEIDVSLIYADFYFVEALIRYLDLVPATPPPPDTTDPVITLAGANPQVIEIGDGYVELGATASDDVDGNLTSSIAIDASAVEPTSLGTYTVTYSVSDAAGNTASKSRSVEVVDTTKPVIVLSGANPQVIEVGDPYGELGATASDAFYGAIGGITIDASDVDTDTPGTYGVTYDVTDTNGNAANTVTRTVRVVDTQPPVITVVGADPQIIDVGDGYTELGATATDNVDGTVSVDIDASDVDTSTPGGYTVTYDATDAAGNDADTRTRSVLVVDADAPSIALVGVNPQVIGIGTPYVELGATAYDVVDGNLTNQITIDASDVDTSSLGSYQVTYDVSDSNGNEAPQRVRGVDVIDLTPPVITLIGANPQTVEVGDRYVERGATATDNVDGTVTSDIVIDASAVDTSTLGAYPVTYDVSDAAGNPAPTATRTVRVVAGDAPPIIRLIGDDPQVIGLGNPYVELGATAFDAIDGDLTSDVTTDADKLDLTQPGMHWVRYAVTDSAGSTTDTLRTIHIVDYFTDDDASIFQAEINAIALAGITKGCNPPINDRYCLTRNVTRGQFAAMIVRAFGFTERAADPFRDDDGSIFEADIERLFASGITKGCNPPANDRYCEDLFLTRGQAAAMFVRAFGYTDDGGGDLFDDDDGSVFEADIDRLATAGVTKGCNPSEGNTRFCPHALITRGQIAAFLARAFNL